MIEKGKPSERVGRKTTGLIHGGGMVAGLPIGKMTVSSTLNAVAFLEGSSLSPLSSSLMAIPPCSSEFKIRNHFLIN